jgi:hypothetical protein
MTKRTIIALEEHYQDPEVVKVLGMESPPSTAGKLEDFDGVRLREMDEAGLPRLTTLRAASLKAEKSRCSNISR